MTNVSVFGTGSWGTALANVLADNGHNCLMWGKTETTIRALNEQHTNHKYLPEAQLNKSLKATTELKQAVLHAEILILAVPTKAIRSVTAQINEVSDAPKIIIHVSKGIEPLTFKRISEMIEEEMGTALLKGVGVLSGPSHAEEVAVKQPTTVAVASKDISVARIAQDLFMNEYFRVYTNDDLIGVEIGGALKNIIALAAGITDGLGYGDNAKAALMTRGLAEITRLGTRMGADPMTFLGLAGIGDLIVTCTSVHSRNWKCGNMLGKGATLDEALAQMGMVVEGVRTTEAAYEMSKAFNVEMPITTALYKLLFEGLDVNTGVMELMSREKKNE
ncbi:NAD(P)H-dependent glycerol-3-phosphate dehydrogenase [Macrococcoides bohemicum]|uniref:Glycerol-3-phosphate dehydrogenase [NAD(P)+] n=2 Tax=Macrococcoides bohemicum TaxID=1903056 RepID=A0A4V6PND6_9STAP|nr:NAD(P)H-dependent glycerol-3-phosphate dehydrogenase [Macrococcus bohemicus]QRN49988.1 NAD(P)H-dependent glycerol-3-phosphate dehydrogenase [Macrococcus bohemicus]QYA41428.1 NAD(P)H-dependent glycerol-3-phosphate dehydrogenase [Macrococcus bohemicus]QYA43852.1 NAD(P)H-dependent glycerol-3-phosphate dehydrogenase [Macrococcus bohemicus]TDL40448.1 NAD(P)H-dependent glycerol-3-phosphate dehydrogenase [Macrococcus bohemicus]